MIQFAKTTICGHGGLITLLTAALVAWALALVAFAPAADGMDDHPLLGGEYTVVSFCAADPANDELPDPDYFNIREALISDNWDLYVRTMRSVDSVCYDSRLLPGATGFTATVDRHYERLVETAAMGCIDIMRAVDEAGAFIFSWAQCP